jgi:hypothetical protein
MLITFALFLVNFSYAYQYDLAICAISRDDERFIKEWVAFHKLVGVQHFYIFCHGNWNAYEEVLQEFIASGEVDLISTDAYNRFGDRDNLIAFNQVQCQAYSDIITITKGKVKWLAVIDSDEFLFSPVEDNLRAFLAKYERFPNIGGISANWQMFGTSWIPKLPLNRTCLESLIGCAPRLASPNIHVKTIVRPETVRHYVNPHYPIYRSHFKQVNTDFVSFQGPFSPYVQVNQLRINHYWTRDQDFYWNYKVPRQLKWRGDKSIEEFQKTEELFNSDMDAEILRFVPELRKMLKLEEDVN